MRWLLAIAITISATTARGDESARARAKGHFKQAKAYQSVGEYAKAAEELQAAYELDPRPEMLFNIGQALRLAGNKRDAVDYFKKYLDAQPNGAGSDEARQHVATLTKEIHEEDARKPPPPPPPPSPVPPDAPPRATQPLPVDRIETRRSPALRIAGIASAGVGVVALGLGVKFGLDARAASDEIDQHTGPWMASDQDVYRDGQAANRNMIVSYAVGGALVVTGGVLYWLGSRTHVTVAPSSHAAMAIVTGSL